MQIAERGGGALQKATNTFATLRVDDDSDEEEERLMKPALVSKQKGQKQLSAPTNLSAYSAPGAHGEEDPTAAREADERAKRKLEKEMEKARLKAERETAKAEEVKMKAAQKAAAATKEVFDASKFCFGEFDVQACHDKYAQRVKVC